MIEDHRAGEENGGYEYYRLNGEPVRVVFDTKGMKMGGDRLNAQEAKLYRAATVMGEVFKAVHCDEISKEEFDQLCLDKLSRIARIDEAIEQHRATLEELSQK